MKALLFDIGGTNIRLAKSNGRTFGKPLLVPVPKRYRQAIGLFQALGKKLVGGEISFVAGGLPGPLDRNKERLLQSTHLPDWANKPFKRDVERLMQARLILENDSAVVGLGEASYGAGQRDDIVAYIGIGTGVGGSRIVHGRIDDNAFGFEPGHQIIDYHIRKHRHPSPHPGDWESFVSGSAVALKYSRSAKDIHDRRKWRKMEAVVALGLVNVAVFWSPEVIVLGGSLMKKLSILRIRQNFYQKCKIFPRPPRMTQGTLGDFGGLYGALELIRQPLRQRR